MSWAKVLLRAKIPPPRLLPHGWCWWRRYECHSRCRYCRRSTTRQGQCQCCPNHCRCGGGGGSSWFGAGHGVCRETATTQVRLVLVMVFAVQRRQYKRKAMDHQQEHSEDWESQSDDIKDVPEVGDGLYKIDCKEAYPTSAEDYMNNSLDGTSKSRRLVAQFRTAVGLKNWIPTIWLYNSERVVSWCYCLCLG